jgi:hypothetical protein
MALMLAPVTTSDSVGASVGDSVGESVGDSVGARVGASVIAVGVGVGVADGFAVGTVVGSALGLGVGLSVDAGGTSQVYVGLFVGTASAGQYLLFSASESVGSVVGVLVFKPSKS